MRGATVLAVCVVMFQHSVPSPGACGLLHLDNELQRASMLSAIVSAFWCMEHNTSCSTDRELQEQSQHPGDVPVALVGLVLWQHKCQSPAKPLSLLGLGFQQWNSPGAACLDL